ncbi:MAG: hypothetical protein GY861_17065 [bacterium]|nr:hypothetical protein [bacterium]
MKTDEEMKEKLGRPTYLGACQGIAIRIVREKHPVLFKKYMAEFEKQQEEDEKSLEPNYKHSARDGHQTIPDQEVHATTEDYKELKDYESEYKSMFWLLIIVAAIFLCFTVLGLIKTGTHYGWW